MERLDYGLGLEAAFGHPEIGKFLRGFSKGHNDIANSSPPKEPSLHLSVRQPFHFA